MPLWPGLAPVRGKAEGIGGTQGELDLSGSLDLNVLSRLCEVQSWTQGLISQPGDHDLSWIRSQTINQLSHLRALKMIGFKGHRTDPCPLETYIPLSSNLFTPPALVFPSQFPQSNPTKKLLTHKLSFEWTCFLNFRYVSPWHFHWADDLFGTLTVKNRTFFPLTIHVSPSLFFLFPSPSIECLLRSGWSG